MSDYDPCGCPSPGHPAHGHAFCPTHYREERERHVYGYGIVDADGRPVWSDCCVSEDPETMQTVVDEELPEDAAARVVRLRWEEVR